MTNSNQEKIFKLMCSDCWQVGVELFKANDLDLYEFIDYAIHRSNYTEIITDKKYSDVVYSKFINITGVPFKITLHWWENKQVYLNAFFDELNVFHYGINYGIEKKPADMMNVIHDKIKPIIYDD